MSEKKLVCESLEEFNFLVEAKEGEHGIGSGVWKAVKTAPGRILRKSRARNIIQKYQKKLTQRINAIVPKYEPNIAKLVEKIKNRIAQINPTASEEIQKNQKEDILDDMKDNMKSLLDSMKTAMEEQLKIYAESLHDRLTRTGTITGVDFFPEEKTALLSEWKVVEENINKLIQEKLINLLDNVNIKDFQEMKAELEEYINNAKGWFSPTLLTTGTVDDLDPKSDEYKLWDYIFNKAGYTFNQPYLINDTSRFPIRTFSRHIEFKIDANKAKVGYLFVQKDRKRGWIPVLDHPDIIHLIKPKETFAEGLEVVKAIDSALK
jgi:hypothetical protein